MKKKILSLLLVTALLFSLLPASTVASAANGSASDVNCSVVSLKVNAMESPLGIDTLSDFSWSMESNILGQKQSNYQILLAKDEDFHDIVWDTGIVKSSNSVGIPYNGSALTPETNYWWKVIVTDAFGQKYESNTAHFSTGLMDGLDRSVWDGAQFIGSTDIAFGSPFMHVGQAAIQFQIISGDNFSFVFGADDFRFTDKSLNPFNTPGGENFFRVEINTADITEESNPGARFAIYRVGYDQTDNINGDPNVYPYKWGRLPVSSITYANKNQPHTITVQLNNSAVTIQVDGTALPTTASIYSGEIATTREAIGTPIAETTELPAGLEGKTLLRRPGLANTTITPNLTYPESTTANLAASTGGNHNAYPHMNSIGFQVNNVGDQVLINNIVINERNNSTSRVFFSNTVGATYSIFDGAPGVTVNPSTIDVIGTENNVRKPIYRDPSYGSMKYMRTEFAAEKVVSDAKLYATAMGGYEMYINDKRVGNDWFTPGLTQYREYLNYNTYDVTDMINSSGDNAMGALVGVGFYGGYMANTNYNTWTDNLALMAKLVITYTDGTTKTVVTNTADWKVCNDGPVTFTDIYDGYSYDANNEKYIEGWAKTGFVDTYGKWNTAEVITSKHPATGDYTFDKVQITAREDDPVRIANTRTAVRVLNTSFANGENGATYTYDMGTAMTGVPSITIPAGSLKEGDRVAIRSAETIYPGNSDSVDFDGNTIEYHNTLGTPDYKYEDLYGPNGGYRKNAAGKLLFDTNRAALASDLYIASKADETRDVVIQPSNTFHGYRYIQISIPNRQTALPLGNVKGLELSSISKPTNYLNATTTDTSAQYPEGRTAALHEQFFKNTLQSQFGNFISIPTDCPQRNERQGWTGDLQLYSRTATYHSLQTQTFLRQWMKSLSADLGTNGGMGTTSPAYGFNKPNGSDSSIVWGGAMVQAPWQLYKQYNDLLVIEENYPFIKRYIDNTSRGYTAADATYPLLTTVSNLSDHIGLEGNTSSGNGSCLLQNVLLMHLVRSTAVMADEMGDTDYAASLRARYNTMVDSWNRCFVEAETGMTLNRNVSTGALTNTTLNDVTNAYLDSQSTYAYALYYGVVSDTMTITAGDNQGMTYKDFFAKRLSELVANPLKTGNDRGPRPNTSFVLASGGPYTSSGRPYTITTGFAATPSLLPALTSNGSNEAAYALFSNTDYASWLYPVKLGATTQWELWDGYDRALMWGGQSGMNSFNHFALGSSVEWVYEYQMGITTGDSAGYQDFVLQPSAGGNYTSLSGGYESNYGKINVAWTAKGSGEADGNGQTVATNEMTSYSCTVPANTTATLYLPVAAGTKVKTNVYARFMGYTTHNGQEVAQFNLASGGYNFTVDGGTLTVAAADGYVDNSNVSFVLATPDVTSYEVNKSFDVIVTTPGDASNVKIVNENGMAIGKLAQVVTKNADGTKSFRVSIAIGTVGASRTLKALMMPAVSDYQDIGLSLNVAIIPAAPLPAVDMISATSVASAGVNTPFTVTVKTSTNVNRIKIVSESGGSIGILSSSYTEADGVRTWTVSIKVGSKGNRTFTVLGAKASGSYGDISTGKAFNIKIA